MILDNFSQNRVDKLSKMMFSQIKEPSDVEILWLQYEDFTNLSKHFNNKLHKHAFYELHLVLEGVISVADNNQKEYIISSRQAIVVPRNLYHICKYKNRKAKRLSIAFTLPENIMSNDFFVSFNIVELQDSIIEKLHTVFTEADRNTGFSFYVIKNRLHEILWELLNFEKICGVSLLFETNNTHLYINKSKMYINDNLCFPLTCKEVASYCGINEIYLNRIFKNYTGETLLKYIHRKKIDYSIVLLKNKELSLNMISTMLGFQNEYYFNTFFKKMVGMPPATYRNIHLKLR